MAADLRSKTGGSSNGSFRNDKISLRAMHVRAAINVQKHGRGREGLRWSIDIG